MARTVASPAASFTSSTTTAAPSAANRRAIARPIPLPAPVINPTRSFSRIILPAALVSWYNRGAAFPIAGSAQAPVSLVIARSTEPTKSSARKREGGETGKEKEGEEGDRNRDGEQRDAERPRVVEACVGPEAGEGAECRRGAG